MEPTPSPPRHILITGASSGIGRALALAYATTSPIHLSLVARNSDALARLQHEIQDAHPTARVLTLSADVASEKAMSAAIAQARQIHGPIDTVIANAGYGQQGRIEQLTIHEIHQQVAVNVWGVLHTILPTLDDLKLTRGRIAITGSTSSYLALPEVGAYSLSKFGVRALAETLYVELAPYSISTTLLCPGFIDTPIRGPNDPVPAWLKMPAPKAARKMKHAIETRKRELVLTLHSLIGILAARLFPGITLRILRAIEIRQTHLRSRNKS